MAQRQQIKWVIYGIVVGLVPLLLFFVLFLAFLQCVKSSVQHSCSELLREFPLVFFPDGTAAFHHARHSAFAFV